MNEFKKSDLPLDCMEYLLSKEPNLSKLQMAVCRRAVIFGKDHVKILKQEDSENE